MRTIVVMMAFAMLIVAGCGGKADSTAGGPKTGASIKVEPGMQLVKLELPGMT